MWTGSRIHALRKVRCRQDPEARLRDSYFGVTVGVEQSHEVIGVVAASLWQHHGEGRVFAIV